MATKWTNSNSGAPCTLQVTCRDGVLQLVVRNDAGKVTGTLTTADEGQISMFAGDVVHETSKVFR
jgi:hypothetical protein